MALLKNRAEAAEKLYSLLSEHLNDEIELLAIPRGGVPIAFVLADAIKKSIDILMVKKIGHPIHPEYAIGAVSPNSEIIDIKEGISEKYIQTQIESLRKSFQQRYDYFMENQKPKDIKGKTVVILDDGIATGNSMLAAIHLVRSKEPIKIIVATPVIAPETIKKLKEVADEVVYLHAPEPFISVGTHYEEFPQLTDQQVIVQLNKARNFEKNNN